VLRGRLLSCKRERGEELVFFDWMLDSSKAFGWRSIAGVIWNTAKSTFSCTFLTCVCEFCNLTPAMMSPSATHRTEPRPPRNIYKPFSTLLSLSLSHILAALSPKEHITQFMFVRLRSDAIKISPYIQTWWCACSLSSSKDRAPAGKCVGSLSSFKNISEHA
jgi:hypothetical protein